MINEHEEVDSGSICCLSDVAAFPKDDMDTVVGHTPRELPGTLLQKTKAR